MLLLSILICTIIIICYSLYYVTKKEEKYTIPKILWLYWDTEKKPKIVDQIQKYNSDKFQGWSIRFLNSKTIYSYVDKNDIPDEYWSLMKQWQSDWLRLYLLERYGGCWMDASIIVNDPNALNTIWQQSIRQKSVLTGFATTDRYYTHSSGKKIPLVIDNWFIMVPKNSSIMKLWFREFHKAVKIGFLSYKQKAIQDGVDLQGYIHWSTWDNFEWHLGPTYRFGLIRVNFETMERTFTPAAEFYSEIAKNGGVSL
jgi:hypothetical protein